MSLFFVLFLFLNLSSCRSLPNWPALVRARRYAVPAVCSARRPFLSHHLAFFLFLLNVISIYCIPLLNLSSLPTCAYFPQFSNSILPVPPSSLPRPISPFPAIPFNSPAHSPPVFGCQADSPAPRPRASSPCTPMRLALLAIHALFLRFFCCFCCSISPPPFPPSRCESLTSPAPPHRHAAKRPTVTF
jgi:hypothetical protein